MLDIIVPVSPRTNGCPEKSGAAQPKSSPPEQPELFRSALVNLVDPKHPLVRLAGLID
jgi:hypothetical protein